MKMTLMIDLDGTLLGNDIDRFQKQYLSALSTYLVDQIDSKLMLQALMIGIRGMVSNNSAKNTLEETFDHIFYPSVNRSKAELNDIINRFYVEEFPKLEYLTTKENEAINFIQKVMELGMDVVIATNPLFPKLATQHRVNWAGLGKYIPDFKNITTYETFHFSKPNPAYYTEILMQLGWPEQPALVIGNDMEADIQPARKLGIPAFLLETGEENTKKSDPNSGTFSDALNWVKKFENKEIDLSLKEMIIAVLKSTPAALDTLVRKNGIIDFRQKPNSDEWSIYQIIRHLGDVERRVNLPRLQQILNNNNPFLPAEETDSWITDNDTTRLDESLSSFLDFRMKITNLLENLNSEQWDLPARHAIFGPTTLSEILGFVIKHDITHVHQISSNLVNFQM